jgi:tetratricopeptide (TPR) repeat protein
MKAEPIFLHCFRPGPGQPVPRAPGSEAAGPFARVIALVAPGIVLVFLSLISGSAPAQNSAAELSAAAQKECDLGRAATARALRLAHFQQSQTLAERAVAADDRLADAHFALFCSLGEQMRIDGEGLSSVFGFRRMMAALDRTLELKPGHLDALSSKAAFLVRLPAFLGGDAARGERMLREVIWLDPKAVSARLTLARLHAAQGDHEQALAVASEALRLARAERRADLLPEAQATLAELRSAQAEVRMTNP